MSTALPQLGIQASQEVRAPIVSKAVPIGWYKVQIVHVKTDDTPNAEGQRFMLEVGREILEGPYAGTRLYDTLNLVNPSAKAQQIGQAQLADLLLVCGLPAQPEDAAQLMNIPHYAFAKTSRQTPKYPKAKSEIDGVRHINSPPAEGCVTDDLAKYPIPTDLVVAAPTLAEAAAGMAPVPGGMPPANAAAPVPGAPPPAPAAPAPAPVAAAPAPAAAPPQTPAAPAQVPPQVAAPQAPTAPNAPPVAGGATGAAPWQQQ